MFDPRQNKAVPEDTLEENLILLYDNITEFYYYCSFLCDSFAAIVTHEEAIDDATGRGISLCSHWMKQRVKKIKDEAGGILKLWRREINEVET